MKEKIYLLLGILLLLSTIQVFTCDNPVYSVIFLILNFCFAALIVLIFDLGFLGFLFMLVYVVVVILLFVLLVINTKKKPSATRNSFFHAFLVLSIFLFIILFDLFKSIYFYKTYSQDERIYLKTVCGIKIWLVYDQLKKKFNLYLILQALFKDNYSLYSIMAGYILFIALLGAVFLIIELKKKPKKRGK
jgi:NADH:ubiquinone oxidoreductase subunit 6 (subunit J)